MAIIEIKVPDIGGIADVPVIELLVKPGDSVRKDQGLLTLESDKATMEVPSTVDGVVREIVVGLGDKVAEGTVVARVEAAAVEEKAVSSRAPPQPSPVKGEGAKAASAMGAASSGPPPQASPVEGEGAKAAGAMGVASSGPPPQPSPVKGEGAEAKPPTAAAAAETGRKADIECQVAVLGSGPGGYTAAFRAADLGLNVVLVERYDTLGGVCLNVGCIPSKALLHAARVIDEAAHSDALGITFGPPSIDLDKLRGYKDKVVGQLTGGLAGMAKQRKVVRLTGTARFVSPHEIEVETSEGSKLLRFERAIIAAGSQAVKLPGLPWGDPRLMDSTDALLLQEIPKRLLVIGGGIIGLEMACVYEALGSRVTVVEMLDQLMPGADPDLVKPFEQRVKKRYESILLKTRVVKLEARAEGLLATFEGDTAPPPQAYDRVLCAVGRTPNGRSIGAEAAGVVVGERGFIAVDRQMRTNVPHIHAIGDIVGNPMLAHKATHEGKVAAEVCAGHKTEFVARVIPSVAYTDPEVAWVGVTELEAKAKGIPIGVGKFPYAASGRAIGVNRTEGFTKLIFDEASHRIIGAGIVGPNAGDLIAETALAIEMGADATDIALTVHPHPTLSESIGMAAEVYEGTITDLYLPRKR